MPIKYILIILSILIVWPCKGQTSKRIETPSFINVKHTIDTIDKIKVLNFGTFHMGFSTDLNQTEFNQHNKENKIAVHAIAKKLAAFKPTVIIVEIEPKYNDQLKTEYNSYVKNPIKFFKNPSEVELLAFELGR